MGNPSESTDLLANRVKSLLIRSPYEEEKLRRSKQYSEEGVKAGAKAAAVACVASTIPTLIAVRKIPWAKANINHTGQALIIASATIAAFFITSDKTVMKLARENTHYKST